MSVWLPSAPCTPRGCATHPGPAAGSLQVAARLLAGTLTVLAGLLLGPVVALAATVLGRRFRHLMTRSWARAVVRAFGVRIRIVGRPQGPGATLVVANHISWLDIPLIAAALPGRMLAKSEVRRWPVLGPLAARGGTFFVERDRLRALPGTVREMAAAMSGGARVIAFPEGSTWCGRAQGRFRPAVFQAALDAGAAVQPVAISYLPTGAAAFVGEDSLTASLWRVAAAGGLAAEIRLLPVIPASSFPDRRSLARAAQRAVARDSANLPSVSVHQFVSSSPEAASSARTPS
ncbi:lysophospholipid acyltransferase family protein [Streptomyces sp. NBC_00829]|uniref:lysophospholipid acyltransferase family protein n=1 Tax=Streptomyces sp. NBC_00829 TaxID=2903679 RepID=UPI003869374F|nr:1-acyl-sn-glycerol-3-phosphate acyltransferase [Streptomyces sp. NBC_00829]